MKKNYMTPESFVIALEVEDIVTASKPSKPAVTTTTQADLDPADPWIPTITDWE